MDDLEFARLVRSIQTAIDLLELLQSMYRRETGKDYIPGGGKEIPNVAA